MRYNELFIENLEKLSIIMSNNGEYFRSRAYKKAQEYIMTISMDINSPNELKELTGFGNKIIDLLNELVYTGKISIIKNDEMNPLNVLINVYGIGPKKANELIIKGIVSIDNLRENTNLLNNKQLIGLKYYDDLLQRITREEIIEYENIYKKILITEDTKFQIVGSYRRGHNTSGDIDVIITSKNENIFNNIIDYLVNINHIIEILSIGPCKCLVICKLTKDSVARRVDFLFTSPEEYPFSILYFTGSKIFNTVMRQHALNMGYTMNEHGLYNVKNKCKGDKILHNFTSETDIFDFLNLIYKTPIERIDGRSVVISKSSFNKSI
jgi:DNA polymerase/3'-5' exonuclease PolX